MWLCNPLAVVNLFLPSVSSRCHLPSGGGRRWYVTLPNHTRSRLGSFADFPARQPVGWLRGSPAFLGLSAPLEVCVGFSKTGNRAAIESRPPGVLVSKTTQISSDGGLEIFVFVIGSTVSQSGSTAMSALAAKSGLVQSSSPTNWANVIVASSSLANENPVAR